MDREIILAGILAVLAGIVVELFFQLIKYRDGLNSKYPVPMTAYGQLTDATNYMSVSQYLSGGRRKWINYYFFRLLPPFIILLLLAGVLDRYFYIQYCTPYILLAGVISLIPRDIILTFKADLISERIMHFMNTLMVFVLSVGVSVVAYNIHLGFIAPSISGLIDNLWSSLIVAILVVTYIKATNLGKEDEDKRIKDVTISNYVVSSYNKINTAYSAIIDTTCEQYRCSRILLYAVLVYENMNRPHWIRVCENILVKLFRLNLTVGIAQVRSNIPLTDAQSITKAAEILGNSNELDSMFSVDDFNEVIGKYNLAPNYANSIGIVIEKLRIYESSIIENNL